MNKRVKVLVVVLSTVGISAAGILLVLIVWMNLTSGYFRYSKNCRIDYVTDNVANKLLTGLENCSAKAIGNFLLGLAKLDFNRGGTTRVSNLPPITPQKTPTPVNTPSETRVASISSIPIAAGQLKGWSYKSNGECGVKFPIPPKDDPYFQPKDSNKGEKIGEYSLFWDFPRGVISSSLLPRFGSVPFMDKQAVAWYVPDAAGGSGYVSSAVYVSCLPNSKKINNQQMLVTLNEKLREYNQDTTRIKEMGPDRYTVIKSVETRRWQHQVVDLIVSEYYQNSPGYSSTTNIENYTMFTTPQYIYEVKIEGATTNAFVKQTAQKIFDNLIFE